MNRFKKRVNPLRKCTVGGPDIDREERVLLIKKTAGKNKITYASELWRSSGSLSKGKREETALEYVSGKREEWTALEEIHEKRKITG